MDPAAPPRLDQRRGVPACEDRRALELDARGELAQRPHARLDPRAAHGGRAPGPRRALLARPSVELGKRPAPALHRRDAEIHELDRLAAALVPVARPVGREERHGQGRGVVERRGDRHLVALPREAAVRRARQRRPRQFLARALDQRGERGRELPGGERG